VISEYDRLWHITERSLGNYRHSEIVVQNRLYNFLVADSILILSWATLFSQTQSTSGVTALTALSVLSLMFSIGYTFFGIRQKKFVDMHLAITDYYEQLTPESIRTIGLGSALIDGQTITVIIDGQKDTYRLRFLEKLARSVHFLVWMPGAFAVVSAILVVVSVLRFF